MRELRDEGIVRAIGAGMNFPEPLTRIAREGVDCMLMAGRYTLLDRSGAGLLDECASLGVDVFAAGVFNSGILAGGTTFNYQPAPPELLARAQAVFDECSRRGVSATAAALQFPLTHPAVKRVLVGARSPGRAARRRRGLRGEAPRSDRERDRRLRRRDAEGEALLEVEVDRVGVVVA